MIFSWGNNFPKVSWELDKNCGCVINGQFLNVCGFFTQTLLMLKYLNFDIPGSNFHLRPNSFEISALCLSGVTSIIFRLSNWDHTMKAFIGLFIWFNLCFLVCNGKKGVIYTFWNFGIDISESLFWWLLTDRRGFLLSVNHI